MRFVWFACLLISLLSAGYGVLGFLFATSAPQEGAVAAMACLGIIAPYVIARALSELRR